MIKLPIRAKAMGAAALALLAFVILTPEEAQANHIPLLAIRENRAEDPLQYGPWNTAAQTAWALEHRQARFCINGLFDWTAFVAFRAAVSDWNTAFSVPGGPPLVENCAWDVGFHPRLSDYPCGPADHACTRFYRGSPIRGGYYNVRANIWFDTSRGDWIFDGWRAVGAHELGHVFGLDEAYVDDGSAPLFTCTSGTSIMDTAHSTGHCDGITSPTSADKARAYDFYNMRPIPLDPTLYLVSPEIYRYGFADRQWAEANYEEIVQRWDGAGTWVDFAYQGDNGVDFAPCDDDQSCVLTDIFPVSGSGYFRVCLETGNGVYGARPRTCSNYVYDP